MIQSLKTDLPDIFYFVNIFMSIFYKKRTLQNLQGSTLSRHKDSKLNLRRQNSLFS